MVNTVQLHQQTPESVVERFFAFQEIVYQQLADELHNDIGQRVALIQMLLDGWWTRTQRGLEDRELHRTVLSPDRIRNELNDLAKRVGEISSRFGGRLFVEQNIENAISVIAHTYQAKHTVRLKIHSGVYSRETVSQIDELESPTTESNGHLYRFRRTTSIPQTTTVPSCIFVHFVRMIQLIFRWFDLRTDASEIALDIEISDPIRLTGQQKASERKLTAPSTPHTRVPSPDEQMEAIRFLIAQRIHILHGEWNVLQTSDTLSISCILPATKEN